MKSKNKFLFLFPHLIIRQEHLSRKDVRKIKSALCEKVGITTLLVSIFFVVILFIIAIVMANNSNAKMIEDFGVTGLVGISIAIISCFVAIVVEITALFLKQEKQKLGFALAGNIILFIGTLVDIVLSIYADAEMGHTVDMNAFSPSMMLLAVLMLIQPAFWVPAAILNFSITASVIGVSVYCSSAFGMSCLPYYILVAIIAPFAAYLLIVVVFYAETQRYCQQIRSDMLYNTAIYDELTKCKNRFALKNFISENENRWRKSATNLLMIMFDIDDFKLYNDQFSHLGGDYCLSTVCEAIRKEFQAPNLDFFRYGGEEFLLFFEIRNPNDAPMILEKVRRAVKSTRINAPVGAPKKVVTISVGGSVIQTLGTFDFEKSLALVDSYLYKAKDAGKDVCVIDGVILD